MNKATEAQNLLAIKLAKAESDSFQFHSLARSYKKYNSEYHSFYHKFYQARVQRDLILFKIPKSVLDRACYWFLLASQFHDQAEDTLDNKYWQIVTVSLTIYYLIILTHLHKALSDQVNYREIYLNESSGKIFPQEINMHPLFLKAKKLGYNEMQIWKTHHNRKYSKFIKHATEVMSQLGCDEKYAKKAAHYLVLASKYHDKAEAIEDRISKKTEHIWKNAYINLQMYYSYLLLGFHKN